MYFSVQRSRIPLINPPFLSSAGPCLRCGWMLVWPTTRERVRQNAWCCTSLQTALTRPPAGLPADCRIEKASGIELSSQGGREIENDRRQMSNVRFVILLLVLKDGGVTLRGGGWGEGQTQVVELFNTCAYAYPATVFMSNLTGKGGGGGLSEADSPFI